MTATCSRHQSSLIKLPGCTPMSLGFDHLRKQDSGLLFTDHQPARLHNGHCGRPLPLVEKTRQSSWFSQKFLGAQYTYGFAHQMAIPCKLTWDLYVQENSYRARHLSPYRTTPKGEQWHLKTICRRSGGPQRHHLHYRDPQPELTET